MKRMGLILGLFGLTSAVFGLDLQPSVGGSLGYTFDSRRYQGQGSPSGGSWEKKDYTTTRNNFDAAVFFDATYVEAAIALGVQAGQLHTRLVTVDTGPINSTTTQDSDIDTQFLELDGRIMGKYPLSFGNLTVFPLAGLEYSWILSSKSLDQTPISQSEFNDLFLDLGAGLDFPIGQRLYFRAEGFYGLNLTPRAKSIKDSTSSGGYSYSDFGYRLNVVAAIGYNL